MADGVEIGKGRIDVHADTTSFDAAMNALPKKAAAKMDAAMKALQAKAAATKLELNAAYKRGDLEAQQRLLPIYDSLKAKIDAVTNATVRQAQAIQAASIAAAAQAQAQQRAAANAAKVAATGQGMNSIWLDQQTAGKFEAIGAAGTKAGNQIRQAGANGAMGLMILSQTIDDARFGLSAVVNNMPQVGMAIGQALGASAESAMAFGGAMGIAAVAVNTWVSKADHVKAIFGREQSEDVKELTDQLGTMRDTLMSLGATLVNISAGGGFDWVSMAGKDVDAATKQIEAKKAAEAKAAQRAANNQSAVSGISAQGADERGAGFVKAVQAVGGGDKLANDIANRRMASLGIGRLQGEARTKREQQIRDEVNADIAAAKAGDRGAIGRLGGEDARLKGRIAFHAPGAQEARDKQAREVDRDATRTAKSLEDTVGRKLLANPDIQIWGEIMEAMKRAGHSSKEIADTLPAVAVKLRASIDDQVKGRAAADGIDAAEARKRLLADAAEQDRRKLEGTPAAREAERLANAMEGGVGKSLLAGGGMGDRELEDRVRKGLKASGMDDAKIDESAGLVARKLREKVDSQVQERALGEGVSEGAAREQLLREANERAEGDRPKSEVMSTESYLNKVLVAGLNKTGDDTPKNQLAEAKTTNKKLDAMLKELAKPKKGTYATAAPGGR